MLSTAITAAHKAGDFIKENYKGDFRVGYKGDKTIVSEIDTGAEKLILEVITQQYPDHSYFSEESGMTDKNSDYLWVIDPLDGTTNFTRGIPRFGVSIGLFYQHKPLLGVIYNPLLGELYAAQVQKGAFLNDQPIHVGSVQTVDESVLSMGRSPSIQEKERAGIIYKAISPSIRTVRITGSIALDLANIAAGQLDCLIFNGCKFYDAAAGVVIAQEAGATVTNFKGSPWSVTDECSDLLIANPTLHAELLPLVRNL